MSGSQGMGGMQRGFTMPRNDTFMRPRQSMPMQAPVYDPGYGAAQANTFSNSIGNLRMSPQQSAVTQDPFQAAIQNNNTANAKPLWMQQGPIEQVAPQAKGLVMSEGQAKTSTPPWLQNNPSVNRPPNGGVPPMPTTPMQQGQAGWQWDNQRNQFLPQWTPEVRQEIINKAYGSGVPAPWMNKGVMDSEYTDPNFLANFRKLGG